MEIDAKADLGFLEVAMKLDIVVDGVPVVLNASHTGETHSLRFKSSQDNWAVSTASLLMTQITRQLHKAILPQLRVAVADAVSQVLPPVDGGGGPGASATVSAIDIAGDPTPHPDGPTGR